MRLRVTLLAAAMFGIVGTVSAADVDRQATIDRALSLINAHPDSFNLPAANLSRSARTLSLATTQSATGSDQFKARDVIVDADGTEHVRLDRFFGGLPVVGGDVVSHSRGGVLGSVSMKLATAKRPSVTPKISADQARVEAAAAFPGDINGVPETSLALYARGVAPTLAYQVHVLGDRNDGVPIGDIIYYVDAQTGAVLGLDDQVETAAAQGTGRSLTLGNVTITTNSVSGGFQLVDPSRGNGATYDAHNQSDVFNTSAATLYASASNTWGNNATSDRATVASDIYYGVAATWDYYKNVHGRTGIFNDGKGVKSYAHVGQNYVNAFWYASTKSMYYGDGNASQGYLPLVALDVAGHEMSHGVNSATANLGYYSVKDSGGLNEANSDILGTLVEFNANVPGHPGNYLIGEAVYASNPNGTKALRLMFKQDADGRSFSCYPTGGFTASKTTQGGVYDPHYSSGVGNRFFYLLAEGPVVPAGFNYQPKDLVCNGNTSFAGIGRDKAGKIWYRALSVYFTSTSTYPDARAATIKAANDLYGANSTESKAVATAWSAVSVN